MRFDDTQQLHGDFELHIRRHGEIVAEHIERNTIMTSAKNALARLVAGDGDGRTVTQIGFGTSGDGPSPDDTALTAAFIKPVTRHSYPAAGQVRFDWKLETTEANGKGIREFGLITAGGVLFARKTRAVIEKADDISFEGSWTIIF